MRHRVAGKKLNRTSSHRKALAKNLMRAFLIEWQGKGHIVTTRSKAKFIQPKIEKLISLSRNKTVHNVRRAMSLIGDRDAVRVLFDEIGPYYNERPGGYTRVLRLVKPRLGDASIRAYLGYVRADDDYPEGDCRAKDTVESAATGEAVVSEETPSEEIVSEEVVSEEVASETADPVASEDGDAQGATAADSAAAEEPESGEVVPEAQDESESADEIAAESDDASESAESEVEDSSSSEEEKESPSDKDQ
ncbi:MAG: 50S ribosomal protein L17 [Planctomycetota bacterium]|nr:50S ribosomal protein L17 [Planctomycetota bacterium]